MTPDDPRINDAEDARLSDVDGLEADYAALRDRDRLLRQQEEAAGYGRASEGRWDW